MKRFMCLTFAALLCLVCLLPLRASASSDYDLAYDATDRMDSAFMNQLGTQTFYRLTELLGAQVRLDIVTGTEGESIEDYAENFYSAYNYGVGADGSCILLMIQCHEDDTGLAYDDYYVLTAGSGEELLGETEMLGLLAELNQHLNADSWSGALEEDVTACENALTAYTDYLSTLGGAGEAAAAEAAAVSAAAVAAAGISSDQYVVDTAGLLTEDERAELNQLAAEASAKYNSGVYVVTVNDYRDYNSESPYEAAKSIFNSGGFGLGDDRSGTMLMLSMNDRDYAYIARGDFGNYAFTDYGKDQLEQEFLDNFRDDDWYGGFRDFITESADYMALAEAGTPVDVEPVNKAAVAAGSVGVGAAVSCAGSAIRCNGLKKKMKTVYTKADATEYIAGGSGKAGAAAGAAAAGIAAGMIAGGIILRASSDQYINTTFKRVPIHVDNDSGKGGGGWSGGTTIDSGGFSGHSGKF